MTANRFEEEARARKVANIVLTAVARKITPAEIADDWVRRMLITNTPGVEAASDQTWRLVVLRLQDLAVLAMSTFPPCNTWPNSGSSHEGAWSP